MTEEDWQLVHQQRLTVADVMRHLVRTPQFKTAIWEKNGSRIDTTDLEKELELKRKRLRQLSSTKDRRGQKLIIRILTPRTMTANIRILWKIFLILSKYLTQKHGKGYTETNLKLMRRFYTVYSQDQLAKQCLPNLKICRQSKPEENRTVRILLMEGIVRSISRKSTAITRGTAEINLRRRDMVVHGRESVISMLRSSPFVSCVLTVELS